MPEWGMLPIPTKLLKAGVTDMLRLSDARMSGTSYGGCLLHCAPEAAVGGPLALVRDRRPHHRGRAGAAHPPGGRATPNWPRAAPPGSRRRGATSAATAGSSAGTCCRPTRAATSTSSKPASARRWPSRTSTDARDRGMQAMLLKRIGGPLEWTELPDRQPGPGEIRVRVGGLRRLPHRPACGRRRAARHPAADHPGPRDRRPHRCARRGRRGPAPGPARRRALAGPHLRRLPLLRAASRRTCATGRCSPATRATAASPRPTIADARFAFPLGEQGSDEALAPLLCAGLIGWRALVHGRRGPHAGPVRLRRGGAHPGAGGGVAGPRGVRVHAAGRRRQPGLRAQPGRGLGRRLRRDAAAAAGCGDHLRRRSARWCRWRCRRCARAAGWSAPAST